MILLLENYITGGISSVMDDRCIISNDSKKIFYIITNNFYGHSMSQQSPSDEIDFDRNFELEDILNSPDDSDIDYFVEVDLKYPDEIKEKNSPFCPENKNSSKAKFSNHMNDIKPDNCTHKKS